MAEIVFVLGAGASSSAGAPLMADFMNAAERLRKDPTHDRTFEADIQSVIAAVEELQQVFVKSSLDIDNIEHIFGAVEMARLIRRFPGKSAEEIDALATSVKRVIVTTLESTVRFPFRQGHLRPPSTYSEFSNIVAALNRRGSGVIRCATITFNYDLALDFALDQGVDRPSYCLAGPETASRARLLKLHGSLNWGRCRSCGKVSALTFEEWFRHKLFTEEADVMMPLGSQLGRTLTCCGQQVDPDPVLVPPTWNKTEYHLSLQNVWKQAAVELSEAEQIYVIGYSLPDSDMFFRYLYALGSVSKRRLRRFTVINKDQSVSPRFKMLLGGSADRVYRFDPSTFERAISLLESELLSS